MEHVRSQPSLRSQRRHPNSKLEGQLKSFTSRIPWIPIVLCCLVATFWVRTYWYRDEVGIVMGRSQYSLLSHDSIVFAFEKNLYPTSQPLTLSVHAYKGSVREYGMTPAIFDCP